MHRVRRLHPDLPYPRTQPATHRGQHRPHRGPRGLHRLPGLRGDLPRRRPGRRGRHRPRPHCRRRHAHRPGPGEDLPRLWGQRPRTTARRPPHPAASRTEQPLPPMPTSSPRRLRLIPAPWSAVFAGPILWLHLSHGPFLAGQASSGLNCPVGSNPFCQKCVSNVGCGPPRRRTATSRPVTCTYGAP